MQFKEILLEDSRDSQPQVTTQPQPHAQVQAEPLTSDRMSILPILPTRDLILCSQKEKMSFEPAHDWLHGLTLIGCARINATSWWDLGIQGKYVGVRSLLAVRLRKPHNIDSYSPYQPCMLPALPPKFLTHAVKFFLLGLFLVLTRVPPRPQMRILCSILIFPMRGLS